MLMRKTVKVDYDETSSTLTLDPSSVQLAQGDWVEWQFSNVPQGCIPWISFEGLGPFQCLQLVPNTTTVQGKGNVGTNASYTYTAWLLTYGGVSAKSDSAVVVNLQQAPNTSPEVVVRYHDGLLDVQPEELTLSPGDTAIWNVFGLPADHFVILQFDRLASAAHPEALFESFLNCRPVDPSGGVLICGINFNAFGNASEYTYHIEVRDSSGMVVASHDPTIDNLGLPPLG